MEITTKKCRDHDYQKNSPATPTFSVSPFFSLYLYYTFLSIFIFIFTIRDIDKIMAYLSVKAPPGRGGSDNVTPEGDMHYI